MLLQTLTVSATTPLSAEASETQNPCRAEPLVHLFKIPQLAAPEESRILATLSAEECLRAQRFRFERDRHTFLVVRASLRRLLAACLDVPPAHLVFTYNEFGKPQLADAPGLYFNVSHARGAAAIALSRNGRIGVDVEQITRERATHEAVRQYFSARESLALDDCSEGARHELFFALWTLKEAYLKARDEGLSIPLDRFGFSLAQDMAEIRFESRLGDRAEDWQFCTRVVFSDYRWSVAIEMPAASHCLAQIVHYS